MVIDTGVLLAAADLKDPRHEEGIAAIDGPTPTGLIIPTPVLNELDYFFEKRRLTDAWMTICEDVADGRYSLHPVGPSILLEAARLQHRYADLRLGFVDAAVFLTCVELGEDTVATFDRLHFSVLRTPDGKALEILPG